MRIAVLGTGMVGRVLAAGLERSGHHVVVGTRDPDRTRAARGSDPAGGAPFSAWAAEHPQIGLHTLAVAAEQADVIVNATSGAHSLEALREAGLDRRGAVVLLDVANPLDFTGGMPPTLSIVNTDSLGERLQRAFPHARVVKSLNTMTAHLMTSPEDLGHGGGSVFVSGDDAEAKTVVVSLLREFGWSDIIDLGDITSSRAVEMWLPLWLRLWGALGTPAFNLSVLR